MEATKLGMPAVVLLTEHFLSVAQVIAKSQGMSAMGIVVLPFDPDRMPAEQVQELATKALEEVVEVWTQPSGVDNTRQVIRES